MKNNLPLVSIIMPAYNSAKSIEESIKSIVNQSYNNWELIVVNDGSVDETSNKVLGFKNKKITLIEQKNGGVSKARNNGILEAKGEYIAFLDSDDLWLKDKLEKQMAVLLSTNYKIIYSNSLCFKEDLNKTKILKINISLKLSDKNKILVYDFIPILTVIVVKEIFNDVGLFDEGLQGTEDWDLWIRILQKYDAYYMKDITAKYRISDSGLSGNLYKHYLEEGKVWRKYVDLYDETTTCYRLWFANRKLALIAKQKGDYFIFIKYLLKLFHSPTLLLRYLLLKVINLKN